MAGLDCSIHDQQIPVINAGIHHALSAGPDIEGGGRMFDTDLVKVDGLLYIVLCRVGEATGDRNSGSSRLSGDGCGIASIVVALAVFLYSVARALAVRIRCQLG